MARFKRVKVGQTYTYGPVPLDRFNPPAGVLNHTLETGQTVRVIDLKGCPPANTMGHCYIESLDGIFLGMVCTNSLT